MRMKHGIAFIIVTVIVFSSCEQKQQQAPPPPPELTQQQLPPGHPDISGEMVSAVAGVRWTIPSSWSAAPARQMRVATYSIPAAAGDTEGAECGVFFFGSGQGGNVQMNIDRWVQQFENPRGPEQTTKEVNGLKVVLVKIAGTYLAPGGPMMQATGKHEHYRLLGAIVAAPEGSVFFKLTGPAKTIDAAEGDFNSLVKSLRAASSQ
jgi:hypothetical protein